MYAVLFTPHGLLVHRKKECDGGVSHVVAYVSTLYVWHVTTIAQLFRIVLLSGETAKFLCLHWVQ